MSGSCESIPDQDFLDAVKKRPDGQPTYVVLNILKGYPLYPPYRPDLKVSSVRSRLKKMEKEGLVESFREHHSMLSWKVVDDPES